MFARLFRYSRAVLCALTLFAPLALADKAFVNDMLSGDALRLEARLRREAQGNKKPVADLLKDADLAIQKNDWKGVAKALVAASVGEPQNPMLLLRLADAYGRIDARNSYDERLELQTRMSAAAFLAYQRATTPDAEALSLSRLSHTLAVRQFWRPALEALRLSLAAKADPAVKARYEALLAEHGFRILEYTVDSDAASPRACFQFSEELKKRLDPALYVVMPQGVPGGLSVEGQQLCVDGLKHGERYQITLRAGLPSQVGEKLRAAAGYEIYVRDRTPSVRFTGRNYILPRSGQQGIPLVSINLNEVGLEIYRFNERSLTRAMLHDGFMGALSGEDARKIAEKTGAKVWSGQLATQNRLNDEVVTAFPVSEAVGALSPGIYVMMARRADVPGNTDSWESQSTQWFMVSDIGLSAVSGADGLHVETRSLASGAVEAGVELTLLALNNEVLGQGTSDADGVVHFEAGLLRGEGGLEPGLITARTKAGDYAALSLTAAAFDLTDRGVTGRTAPGPLDGFVYTERGVYRSGETVHVAAMLRDPAGQAVKALPLTLVMERPDGAEYRRLVLEDQGLGGRSASIALIEGAAGGTWRLKLYSDPKRPAVGETQFLVEDYVPDRLSLELKPALGTLAAGQAAQIELEGRYLFGAPASELELEGEVVLQASNEPPAGLAGYKVGLQDEEVSPVRRPIAVLPRTGKDGKARLSVPMPSLLASSRPLSAQVLIRLLEAGGRAVERKAAFQIAEARPFIGVRPLFGESVGEGETATFDVAYLAANGQIGAAKGVRWELFRINRKFQWYRADGRWNYEAVTATERVADGRVDTAAGALARIAAKVSWGQYRLDVSHNEGGEAATSVSFTAGYAGAIGADAPDVLEIALDKSEYKAGEQAKLRIQSRFAGEARIDVVADGLLARRQVSLKEGANSVDLDVAAEWGTGAYVVVTAFRPLDASAKRMPGRAMGLVWLGLDRSARLIGVRVDAPAQVAPRGTLSVPVQLTGLEGQEAMITVSAVDVGILNLTGYKTPAPGAWYFGQRALGAEFRDVYGHLIDGMAGIRGRIRSGGDGAGAGLQGSPPTQAPLAQFSGLVKVGPDGKAVVSFDIPDFAGTVRVAVVAWSASRVGHASADVVVRDRIVVQANAPRFMAMGDQARVSVMVHNVDGPAGEYALTMVPSGPVRLIESGRPRVLKLEPGGKGSLQLDVAALEPGIGEIALSASGPQGIVSGQTLRLRIQPAHPAIQQRFTRPLAAGGQMELTDAMLSGVVPGTGLLSVSVAPHAGADVAGLMTALDRYAFGCTEQVISRAMPLLYLDALGREHDFALSAPASESVKGAIDRILSRQGNNGVFGLWGVGEGDLWLNAYAVDFLSRAREKGYAVPKDALDSALDYLRNTVANTTEMTDGSGQAHAYALYALARNGRPVIGDLRYLADTKLKELGSPLAQGQVGAALGMLGDLHRANLALASAVTSLKDPTQASASRNDYGSPARDAAGLLTLIAEGGLDARPVSGLFKAMEAATASGTQPPQTNAWMAMAAQALRKDSARMVLTLNGEAQAGPFSRAYRQEDLAGRPQVLANAGPDEVFASISVSGSPLSAPPASAAELKLERTLYRLDGTRHPGGTFARNERLIVVLRVTEAEPRAGQLALVDPLPAGFEIENPALLESAKLTAIRLPPSDVAPVATQFRDDRFFAAFERKSDDPQVFSVAYMVRAVTSGSFMQAGGSVEDMYRPARLVRLGAAQITIGDAP